MDIREDVIVETTPERGNELKAILFKYLLEKKQLIKNQKERF